MRSKGIVMLSVWVVALAFGPVALGGSFVAEPIADKTVPHHNGGVVAYSGNVYAWTGYSLGGTYNRTNVLEKYDPATNTWSILSNFPVLRSGNGSFVLNGKFYSVGGEGNTSGSFSNGVHRYDPATDSWTAINSFPTRTWDPLEALVGDTPYIFGGRRGYGRTYSNVNAYDEASDTWTSKSDMPYSVMLAAAVEYDGKIWVFGGLHKTSEPSNQWINTVQVYDPGADTWSLKSYMPHTFSASTAFVYNDRIWLFTDRITDDPDNPIANEYIYEIAIDPLTEDWSWTPHNFQMPVGTQYGTDLAMVGDYVYIIDKWMDSVGAYRVQIPEPATLSLLAVGGLALIRRRRK